MMDAGLFRLALAKEVGGSESHPVLEMEVYEAVARISVSAAWNLIASNYHAAWASAYLPDEAIAEVFPSGHRTMIAGQATPSGKGRKSDGGYRVTGHYTFGSGIAHANWVFGGFNIDGEDGQRIFVAPKASAIVLDNWHASGLEGSGSFDFAVEDLFVPKDFTFPLLCTTPRRGGPRFTLPWNAQASVPHLAVALGGAEHAFEAIARLAPNKRRGLQQEVVASRGAFQRDLGEGYVRLCAARDHAARLIEHMTERAAKGSPLNQSEADEMTATGTHCCTLATEVAAMAFRYGGGDSVRLDSPIQRALRDVLVAQQHILVADTSFDALGRAIIGQVAPS